MHRLTNQPIHYTLYILKIFLSRIYEFDPRGVSVICQVVTVRRSFYLMSVYVLITRNAMIGPLQVDMSVQNGVSTIFSLFDRACKAIDLRSK